VLFCTGKALYSTQHIEREYRQIRRGRETHTRDQGVSGGARQDAGAENSGDTLGPGSGAGAYLASVVVSGFTEKKYSAATCVSAQDYRQQGFSMWR